MSHQLITPLITKYYISFLSFYVEKSKSSNYQIRTLFSFLFAYILITTFTIVFWFGCSRGIHLYPEFFPSFIITLSFANRSFEISFYLDINFCSQFHYNLELKLLFQIFNAHTNLISIKVKFHFNKGKNKTIQQKHVKAVDNSEILFFFYFYCKKK